MQLGNKWCELPFLQGGMGIGVSLGRLAGTVASFGAVGTISTANPGYREPDFWENPHAANTRALAAEIQKAKTLAKGKGLIAINAMVATRDYAAAIATAIEQGIDCIVSGAGLPLELPHLVGDAPVAIAPIVSSGKAAQVICKRWMKRDGRLPDFVVVEGSLAGGHLGFSLAELQNGTAKPLSALVTEVKAALAPFAEQLGRAIPVIAAGGIATRQAVVELLAGGADGVQVATRFITTEECDASERFKRHYLGASSDQIELVQSPVGMPGRALHTKLLERIAVERRMPEHCIGCLVPCQPATTPYCITKALIEAAKGNLDEGLCFCGAHGGTATQLETVQSVLSELLGWEETK